MLIYFWVIGLTPAVLYFSHPGKYYIIHTSMVLRGQIPLTLFVSSKLMMLTLLQFVGGCKMAQQVSLLGLTRLQLRLRWKTEKYTEGMRQICAVTRFIYTDNNMRNTKIKSVTFIFSLKLIISTVIVSGSRVIYLPFHREE